MDSPSNILYNVENQAHKSRMAANTAAKLLLFDIDSTLVSVQSGIPQKLVADSFETVFGLRPSLELTGSFAGKTDLQILIELGETIGLLKEDIIHLHRQVVEELTRRSAMTFTRETVDILPGVMDFLMIAADNCQCVMGLVTGNNESCAFLKLRTYGLDRFFHFGAFGCESEDRNNLPAVAMKRAKHRFPHYSFTTESTWIIGDSPADIQCALANNMLCLGVATGQYSSEQFTTSGAHYVVENLKDYQEVANIVFQ
ncbi:MAG: HAD hydrolase-like protein [Ignavibacteria bacterium]|nr:HAD hydrolase-like protein [Ignavibacteria bacterium]